MPVADHRRVSGTGRGMLTPKRERFAQLMAAGELSQVDCHRIAFASNKMTDKQRHEEASKLASDPKVRQRINDLRRPAIEAAQIDLTRVVKELVRLATFDPRKLLNEDGSPKPINELDDDTAAAVAGLDLMEQFEGQGKDRVFVGYVKKYKIADKNAALDKLMKHLGGYEKDNRQKSDGVLALLQAVAQSNSGAPAFPIVGDPDGDGGA